MYLRNGAAEVRRKVTCIGLDYELLLTLCVTPPRIERAVMEYIYFLNNDNSL